MRLIRLLVGTERLAELTDVLDGEGIDFVVTEERGRDAVIVEFPLPVQAMENVDRTLDESGRWRSWVSPSPLPSSRPRPPSASVSCGGFPSSRSVPASCW